MDERMFLSQLSLMWNDLRVDARRRNDYGTESEFWGYSVEAHNKAWVAEPF